MTEKRFEAAQGIGAPWLVSDTEFNAQARTVTIRLAHCPRGAVVGLLKALSADR